MAQNSQNSGVFSAEMLTSAITAGAITGAAPARVQPASLDLALGERAWRIRASFLPGARASVADRLEAGLGMQAMDIRDGAVFERGCVYLVELQERLSLDRTVFGAANPKSSTGRIDVFVRLVTDRATAFDEIPAGYQGPLYAEISPRSFSIIARTGSRLNQIRLKSGPCGLSDEDVRALQSEAGLVDGDVNIDNGLGLGISLSSNDGVVGWRARRHTGLIDVDRAGDLDALDFFEPIAQPRAGFLILDPDEFYILASRQCLKIPPHTAAEMTPISPRLGEFRVHYAGFFDPGFGYSDDKAAQANARAVLEVRSREVPFALEDGQLVARLVYERMAQTPTELYGVDGVNHYQGQGLKLSKHFQPPVFENDEQA